MKRLIPVVALVVSLGAAPAASAAVDLSGGTTRLTLDRGTAKALGALGVKVAPTGAARAQGRHVRFPISGGSIDPASAAGRIAHRGGLRLSAGDKRIVLKDYVVRVGRTITLSARVGGTRATILKLTGTPKLSRSGFGTNVAGLTARLNRTAAKALNATFGVQAFKRGIPLGTIRVQAEPAQTELLAAGATALTIAPSAFQALASQGIAPGVIGPATLDGTTASFPITGGRAALDLSAVSVTHSGGLSLTKGATVVRLTDFDIRPPQLFASIDGGAQKVAILDLAGGQPTVSGRSITLGGVAATLSPGAAAALNAAFGTSAFAGGLAIGSATVSATGK